tara:strand:- start:251 stop:1426 length:1176 start_codon:yes stop_codon:yes gene_type:complete
MSTRKKNAGKAIDSGGFGCVFRPALKCKNKTKRTTGISKLLLTQDNLYEWNILTQIKKYISKINNYDKYFLINHFTTCIPDELTIKDKNNFDKCLSLKENGIYATNINNNLNKLRILNMPDGGINLDKVINNNILSFNKLNNLLINLLNNAIIPMNNLNIYHFDIKSSNILYKNDNIKIIDFGELGIVNKKYPIPNILFNRGIQFNSPFTRLLFNKYFISNIESLISQAKLKKPNNTIILNIVKNSYQQYINNFSLGHELFLAHYLLPKIFTLIPKNIIKNIKKNYNTNMEIINEWIINYCSAAIINFFDFKNYKFDKIKYFNQVYSKNVDIYGIITCYIQYLITDNTIYSNKFKIHISQLLLEYCFNYEYATKPYNISTINNNLLLLNKI